MRSRGTADSKTVCACAPVAAGGGGIEGRACAPGRTCCAPPPSIADKMSRLLMRPPAPVPGTCARSTLFSFASRRTNGELRIFSPACSPRRAGRCGAAALPAPAVAGAGLAAVCAGAGDAAAFAESAFAASAFVGADAGDAFSSSCLASGFISCFASGFTCGFAAAGTGAADAAPAPSASITPTTVCIGTVCPSATLISFSTPAAGDGISASTLSVEISNSGSSRSTFSPGFFSHFVTVPSKMLSPIWGIITSVAISVSSKNSISRQLARGGKNIVLVGQKALFKRRRERYRRVLCRDAQNRPVQILERAFARDRRDFSRDAAGARVLVNDQQLVRFFHRLQNGFFVERQQRPQIDDFRLDSLFRQFLGGFERRVHHRRVRHNRQVAPLAPHNRFPDRNRIILGGQLFLDSPVQKFVLEEKHRIIVANRRLQ